MVTLLRGCSLGCAACVIGKPGVRRGEEKPRAAFRTIPMDMGLRVATERGMPGAKTRPDTASSAEIMGFFGADELEILSGRRGVAIVAIPRNRSIGRACSRPRHRSTAPLGIAASRD